MATVPTIDEFTQALRAYWRAVGGGNEAQFLNLASQQPRDWDTTVLARWLDILGDQFIAQGYPLASPDYDTGISPLVDQVGVDRASVALKLVVDRARANELQQDENDRRIQKVQVFIDQTNAKLQAAQDGFAEVQAAGLSGPNITALRDVAMAGRTSLLSSVEFAQREIERLS